MVLERSHSQLGAHEWQRKGKCKDGTLQSDRGGEPLGLGCGLIFTPTSSLTGGVATS